MGRNQKFAAIGNGAALLAGYVLVWFDKLDGAVWIAAATAAVGYVITQGRLAKKNKEAAHGKA